MNKRGDFNDKSQFLAEFQIFEDPITKLVSFKIIRKKNKRVLFDSSFAGLIFSDQFIQISTKLSSENIYGFGENNHESLKHDLNFKSWGMFARDNAPGWGVRLLLVLFIFSIYFLLEIIKKDNRNLYGFQPVYLNLEDSGESHAVLLYNSNSMGNSDIENFNLVLFIIPTFQNTLSKVLYFDRSYLSRSIIGQGWS